MSHSILVADDDAHIRHVISFALEKAGMRTAMAADGAEALALIEKGGCDLVILDIGMPEMDGLEVCREARKTSDIPILFLSSHDEEVDRVLGLEIGGDDYVAKPFSPRELVARVKAILKRMRPAPPADSKDGPLVFGPLVVDDSRHVAAWSGAQAPLTATEFAILKGFLKRPRHVLDRASIMRLAYDANIHVSDRTIDSHIRRIRQKFAGLGCETIIETVHGVGYRLGALQ